MHRTYMFNLVDSVFFFLLAQYVKVCKPLNERFLNHLYLSHQY